MSLSYNFFQNKQKPNVLFYRDYLRFQGGHLKVWHYFNHLNQSGLYKPLISFSHRSIQDSTNPWFGIDSLNFWSPVDIDILFLAGLDWEVALTSTDFLKNQSNLPVINLIQGLSHADPNDIKYNFLSERAIRICVSRQVAQAIEDTGCVNGPVFTIPNGIDLNNFPQQLSVYEKEIDVLIVAIKKPELGLHLQKKLGLPVKKTKVITDLLPRAIFLDLLNKSKTCVCLPHFAEGFYLPALEAMALGAIVVCPDCIGNRSFCLDKYNCFAPTYNQDSILAALKQALSLSIEERENILLNASATVRHHDLQGERKQFIDIMNNIKNLW